MEAVALKAVPPQEELASEAVEQQAAAAVQQVRPHSARQRVAEQQAEAAPRARAVLAAPPKAYPATERRTPAHRPAEPNRNNRRTCYRQEVLFGISCTQSCRALRAPQRVRAVPEVEAEPPDAVEAAQPQDAEAESRRRDAEAEWQPPGAEAEQETWPPLVQACRSGYTLLPACSGSASRRMGIGYTLLFLRLSVDRP